MNPEGKVKQKNVLFICVQNSCRSQMAEALFNDLHAEKIKAYSAGSNPSGIVNPFAVKVLNEIGIDIKNAKSKGFEVLSAKQFNYVVSMGCKDRCPFVPAEKYINWEIADPSGKDLAFFRKIRDKIRMNVKKLYSRIKNE